MEIDEVVDDDDHDPSPELLFRILAAKHHYEHTLDQISPDWGPIGETYVADRFAVSLCSRYTEGHDGRLGNELIEIKTITPYKRRAFVTVKRAGNFSMLAVVRVTDDFRLDARFIRRSDLSQGNGGKLMIVDWNTACTLGKKRPPLDAD